MQDHNKLSKLEEDELRSTTGGSALSGAVEVWVDWGCPNDVIARPKPNQDPRFGCDLSKH